MLQRSFCSNIALFDLLNSTASHAIQCGIVDVAAHGIAHVKSRHIIAIEWPIITQPLNQIRIGEKKATERNGIVHTVL